MIGKYSLLKISSSILLLASLLAMTAVNAATIQGRAIGSFCCVKDASGLLDTTAVLDPVTGNLSDDGTGATRYTIANHDNSLPPGTGTTAKVEWGTGQAKSSYLRNYFEFDGNGSDLGSALGATTADSLFQIGTFDYYNAQTRQDNVSSISFDLNMTISNADESMLMAFPTLRFAFDINNTNDNNNPEASKDTVTLANAVMVGVMPDGSDAPITGAMPFSFDGLDYTFILNGFAIVDPTTGLPYTDIDGNFMFSSSTSAYENTLTSAAIYGTIQLASVPVPAAVWLFASGLLGLVTVARRKKS